VSDHELTGARRGANAGRVTPPPPPDTIPDANPSIHDGGSADGFVIHRIDRPPGGLPDEYDDPGGAWARALADAELGDVMVRDADIEMVTTAPLTLVLTTAAGRRIVAARGAGPLGGPYFVVTLDGARLYAGAIMFIGTARVLRHPLIHFLNTGASLNMQMVPTIGAHADTALNAPPALLEHFQRAGKLQPAGATPFPRTRRRRLLAAVTATKPGDPTSQVDAHCDDTAGTCTMTLSFRRPGNAAGPWDQTESVAITTADFDPLWAAAMRGALLQTEPGPYAHPNFVPHVIHPPRMRFLIEIERIDGEVIRNDRSWQSPSPSDATVAPFFIAAGALGRQLARSVPVRYFPGEP
jgi:hypothetical protein